MMKKWVSTFMLISLFGSIGSPLLVSAVESTSTPVESSVGEGATMPSITSAPQDTITKESAPILEKTEDTTSSASISNQLSFDKTSEMTIGY
jgi:hypothetical protein